MKKLFITLFLICFLAGGAYAKDITMHETLQINTDSELLMSHEYYKGIKVKSIKIKQVEINKDTSIINGQIIEGEPNRFTVVVEITDMKGNKTELYGTRSLNKGDYSFIINED